MNGLEILQEIRKMEDRLEMAEVLHELCGRYGFSASKARKYQISLEGILTESEEKIKEYEEKLSKLHD